MHCIFQSLTKTIYSQSLSVILIFSITLTYLKFQLLLVPWPIFVPFLFIHNADSILYRIFYWYLGINSHLFFSFTMPIKIL